MTQGLARAMSLFCRAVTAHRNCTFKTYDQGPCPDDQTFSMHCIALLTNYAQSSYIKLVGPCARNAAHCYGSLGALDTIVPIGKYRDPTKRSSQHGNTSRSGSRDSVGSVQPSRSMGTLHEVPAGVPRVLWHLLANSVGLR